MSLGEFPSGMPSIVALYHLADLNDAVGGHTMTNNGSATFGPGKLGNGVELGSNNTSKYLSHADGLGVSLGNNFSVSCIFKLHAAPSSGNYAFLVAWYSTTSPARACLIRYYNNAGTYQLNVSARGAVGTYDITLDLEKFHFLDLSVIDGIAYLYLNGALLTSWSAGTSTTSNDALAIGASSGGSALLSGMVDEVVCFSTGRTAKQVRDRYAQRKGMLA